MDELLLVDMNAEKEKENCYLQLNSIYFTYISISPETKTNTVIARYESSN